MASFLTHHVASSHQLHQHQASVQSAGFANNNNKHCSSSPLPLDLSVKNNTKTRAKADSHQFHQSITFPFKPYDPRLGSDVHFVNKNLANGFQQRAFSNQQPFLVAPGIAPFNIPAVLEQSLNRLCSIEAIGGLNGIGQQKQPLAHSIVSLNKDVSSALFVDHAPSSEQFDISGAEMLLQTHQENLRMHQFCEENSKLTGGYSTHSTGKHEIREGQGGAQLFICSSATTTSDSDGSCSSLSCGVENQKCLLVMDENETRTDDGTPSEDPQKKDGSIQSLMRPQQQRKQIIRDQAYLERRRKNNDAAKRSRDSRRRKEDEVAIRAIVLEQENSKLKQEVGKLRAEIERHRIMVLNLTQALKNNMFLSPNQLHHPQVLPPATTPLAIAAVAAAVAISSEK